MAKCESRNAAALENALWTLVACGLYEGGGLLGSHLLQDWHCPHDKVYSVAIVENTSVLSRFILFSCIVLNTLRILSEWQVLSHFNYVTLSSDTTI